MLKKGDKVYRVAEYDYPDTRPHTWIVEERTVLSASNKQIGLSRAFSELGRVVYRPDALGRVFHASQLGAVTEFQSRQHEEIDALDHKRDNAKRAISWTEAWIKER